MTDDLDRRMDARIARALRKLADAYAGDTRGACRRVADALDPPEPPFESMERCMKDAEKHCILQHGGGFILYGTGLSTARLANSERHQFTKVIAEILYAARNRRAEVPHG